MDPSLRHLTHIAFNFCCSYQELKDNYRNLSHQLKKKDEQILSLEKVDSRYRYSVFNYIQKFMAYNRKRVADRRLQSTSIST